MESKKFVEHLINLGIEVFKVRRVDASDKFIKVLIDNSYLSKKQMQAIVSMTCFAYLGVCWTYTVPRIEIRIDCTKEI